MVEVRLFLLVIILVMVSLQDVEGQRPGCPTPSSDCPFQPEDTCGIDSDCGGGQICCQQANCRPDKVCSDATKLTEPIDLVFGIPFTTDDGENGFAECKKFIKEVTKSFSVSNRDTNVGIIQYGSDAEVTLPLSEGTSLNKVFEKVDSMTFKPGEQKISKAIQLAQRSVLPSGRSGVRKYFVLACGKTTMSEEEAQQVSKQFLQNQDVTVMSVPVGSESETAQLERIVSFPPDEHFFPSKDFANFGTTIPGKVTNIIKSGSSLQTGPIDLVFGVPSTTEHGENGFNEYKDFVKRVTKSFSLSNRDTNVGIIQYGSDAEVTLPLSEGTSLNKVFEKVDSMTFKPGEQNISKAIQLAQRNVLFSGRPGVRKYFVLGCGKTTMSEEEAQQLSKQFLQNQDVTVMPVPVGSESDSPLLREIASFPPEEHFIPTEDFQSLKTIVLRKVTKIIKSGSPLQTGPIDLVFGVPSTTEHGENGFAAYKDFVKRVTKSFSISNRDTNVGIIQYGDDAKVTLPLSEGTSLNKIFEKVDSMSFKPGGQKISRAARLAYADMFPSGRRYAKKYFVLGSGGESIPTMSSRQISWQFQNQGVSVIPTPVGSTSATSKIRQFSSIPSDKYFISSRDFKTFKTAASGQVTKIIRSGGEPGTYRNGRYDIAIGIPDCDFVGATGFEQFKKFTQRFTEQYNPGNGDVRFSMFKYSGQPKTILDFNAGGYSRGVIQNALQTTSYSGGENRIDRAITFGTRMLKSNGRPGVKKSVVLLTTGEPSPHSTDLEVVSKANSEYSVIPIGIGNTGKLNAQKMSRNYIHYNTYNDLVNSGHIRAADAAAAVEAEIVQGRQGPKGPRGDNGPQGRIGDRGPRGPAGQEGGAGDPGDDGDEGPRGFPGPGAVAVINDPDRPGDSKGPSPYEPEFRIGPPGPQGPPGPPGSSGTSGRPGARGDPGSPGPAGDPGEPGQGGLSGPKGRSGTPGDRGSPGPAGGLGETGLAGSPGNPGNPGRQGSQGSKGERGQVGQTGATGEPGNPGPVGYDGDPGRDGLDGRPGTPGQSGSKGNKGAKGDKGPNGVLGRNGPQGPVGLRGNAGLQGQQGSKGDQGTKGSGGAKGRRGDVGKTGIPGPSGAKGVKGGRGPNGEKGSSGPKGDQGVVGPPGPPGYQGRTGNPGPPGQPGSVGDSGARGRDGTPGQAGSPGAKGNQGLQGDPGDPGEPGKTGKPGPRGQPGRIGPRGPSGPKGHRGVAGSSGPRGYDGQKGHGGKTGARGAPGLKGERGDSGEKGLKGARGTQGPPGPMGINGINGKPGMKGERGAPGQAGDSGTYGSLGPMGMSGASGPKGTAGKTGGRGAMGEDGPKGEKGESGLRGPTGAPGKDGEDGQDGDRGEVGLRGNQGSAGPQGEVGAQGLPGAPGAKGFQGPTGSTGLKGEQGAMGENGEPGARGPRGSQGRPGSPGKPGADGKAGEKGPPGPAGPIGNRGPSGDSGAPGIDGAKGQSGESGEPGNNGFDGRPGKDGVPGRNGDQGRQGPPGARGPQGEKGSNGETGTPGAPGERGQAGPDGDIGPRGPAGQIGATGAPGIKGSMGKSGPKGTKGSKGSIGNMGQPGTVGDPGIKGVKGDAGSNGLAGEPGIPGLQGEIGGVGPMGHPGPQGPPGEKGSDGAKGNRGLPGQTGKVGVSGPPGQNGDDGVPGVPGDDGAQGPDGEGGIAGPPGFKGQRGAPGPPGVAGPLGTRGEKGLPGLSGPQGAKGEAGDRGDTGPNGIDGENGTPGEDGLNGADSTEQGQPGQKGDKGDPGFPGFPGTSGPSGPPGDAGAEGEKGKFGNSGDIGEDGPNGDKGVRGPKGVPGDQGKIGERGNDGKPGSAGAKGDMGARGPHGDRGPPGNPGVAGHTGHDGEIGRKGPPGARGKDGVPGNPGIAGPKGPRGPLGDPGPEGRMGMAGPAGPPGDPGPQGPPGPRGRLISVVVPPSHNKGPQNRFYSSKNKKEGYPTDLPPISPIPYEYLAQADAVVEKLLPADGVMKERSARSCRDIKLEYPLFPSGKYWVDPDFGSIQNAILVQCNFDKNETCVGSSNALSKKFTKHDKTREFKYADEIQMTFLRLLSNSVHQRITYHCKNSKALDGDTSINLLGDNGVGIHMQSSKAYRPKLILDECVVKDNKWHKTIFEVTTRHKQRLPIVDVTPFDIGSNEKEYQIEAGHVCFVW